MCFSAEASFGVGAVLTITGIASIKKTNSPKQVLFASIPLLFAIQQISEGFLWLSLEQTDWAFVESTSTYVFLIFAQVFWPIWVPLSILLIERDEQRRKILYFLLIIGLAIGSYLAYCIAVYDVSATIVNHHISYSLDFPFQLSLLAGVIYFMPTVFSPFISSVKQMIYLGLSILISYLVTTVFFHEFIISIWCFFAAVLSGIVLWIVHYMNKPYLRLSVNK
ncbi:MAG: DUF6629 family protein [Bacteroidota bacterium]